MVFGLIWAILLLPEGKSAQIPPYLIFLMFLILGHYFAFRSTAGTPGERPPLYLPRGFIRFLIVVGFIAVLGWGFYHDPKFQDRLVPANLGDQPLLLWVVMGAFFVGVITAQMGKRLFSGPEGPPPWFQDIQAWVSLLAMVGLGAEVIIRLVINPTLAADKQLTLPAWEGTLAAIVAFYFGART
jgi:hypothetical protein